MTWLVRPGDMRLVYIAGPYSARTVFGRIRNIYRAARVALKWWERGYAVICPHMNTALFGELWFRSRRCDYETWMRGDLAILRRCDIVVFMRGWEASKGAVREHELATRLLKEVVYE